MTSEPAHAIQATPSSSRHRCRQSSRSSMLLRFTSGPPTCTSCWPAPGSRWLITAVLSIAGLARRRAGAAPAARHDRRHPADLGEQNLHQRLAVAGPDDELKRARRHHRRAARPPRGGLRRAAPLRRQRLPRAAHPADHDAHRAGRGHPQARPAGPGRHRAGRQDPRAGSTRPTGWWKASSRSPAPSTAAPCDRSTVSLDKLATDRRSPSAPPRSATCTSPSARTITTRRCTGSEALLTHLVGNLIDNAIRHNQPGGWIRVATGTERPARRGSSSRTADRSSTRAGSASWPSRSAAPAPDRTGSDDTGVGLGLSIVAAIAAAHHGTLRPARPPARRAARHRHPPARRPPCARPRQRIMRVLVVEDVHGLADDIAEGLRDEGFAVDVAYNGLDAAAKLDINAYQVVVLDRDLPGIHGDTLCRMITESDRPAMTLMLTAAGTPDDRISGLGLGADDYLTKPFHFPELVLRIRALARRQPTARPRILPRRRPRPRPATPHRHPQRPAPRPVRQGVRRPRSPAPRRARLPQHRRPARTGLGRKRRPLHQHRLQHPQPATPQTRQPALIETRPGVGYRITDPGVRPLA